MFALLNNVQISPTDTNWEENFKRNYFTKVSNTVDDFYLRKFRFIQARAFLNQTGLIEVIDKKHIDTLSKLSISIYYKYKQLVDKHLGHKTLEF